MNMGFYAAGAMGGSPPPPAPWFEIVTWTGSGSGSFTHTGGLDLSGGGMVWVKSRSSTNSMMVYAMAAASSPVYNFTTSGTAAAGSGLATLNSNGFTVPENVSGVSYVAWVFKKTAGVFDIAAYVGNGSSGRSVPHALGAPPKMAFTAALSGTNLNYVQLQSLGGTHYQRLDSSIASTAASNIWNDTDMDSTNVVLGNSSLVNGSGQPFLLFVLGGSGFLAGVFSGAGANYDLNIGELPRWWMFKRDDSNTAGWGVFDTTRGPASWIGNDLNIRVNSTAVEITGTNYLQALAGGVTVVNGQYTASGVSTFWFAIP